MNYSNENRGIIQNRERARQIIDFSGIRYRNITPTDIDGFFERANEAFVFYELKFNDAEMPTGQKVALERLVDATRAANKKAVLFLCRHEIEDTEKDVDAAKAIVKKFYFNGEWHEGNGRNLKEYSDAFMKWAVPDFMR
jgi:hypothetical protein